MKAIADGSRQKQQVFDEALAEMKKIFLQTSSQANIFQRIFSEKFKINNSAGNQGGPGGGGSGGGGPHSDEGPDQYRGPNPKTTNYAPRAQPPSAQATSAATSNHDYGAGGNGQQQFEDSNFMTCPQCGKAKMRVKSVKNSGSLFIACAGYPNCKNTMNLPKGLDKAQM